MLVKLALLMWIVFGKHHQHTVKNDMHIQLSLSLHYCFLYLLLNDAKQLVFLGRLLMALKRASFNLAECSK